MPRFAANENPRIPAGKDAADVAPANLYSPQRSGASDALVRGASATKLTGKFRAAESGSV